MKPVQTALALTGVLTIYLGAGILFGGDKDQNTNQSNSGPDFSVQHTIFTAQTFTQQVALRGHTEALRTVELKAEVAGRVTSTPIEKGTRVQMGDVLCVLDPKEKEAQLDEAKALLDQRELEYSAAQSLREKGHRSETQEAAAKALLDAAIANVTRRELDLAYTTIRAPFDGLVDDRNAEVGAFLQVGHTCASLMYEDPFLVVAEVSEVYVAALRPGISATANIAGFPPLTGKVRYVAGTANSQTRAFRVEVEVENPNRILREGMTATLGIDLKETEAHLLPSSILVLSDDGKIGVRALNDSGLVSFYPVTILDDAPEGIWVGGLPKALDIITVGQDFVAEGDTVGM